MMTLSHQSRLRVCTFCSPVVLTALFQPKLRTHLKSDVAPLFSRCSKWGGLATAAAQRRHFIVLSPQSPPWFHFYYRSPHFNVQFSPCAWIKPHPENDQNRDEAYNGCTAAQALAVTQDGWQCQRLSKRHVCFVCSARWPSPSFMWATLTDSRSTAIDVLTAL